MFKYTLIILVLVLISIFGYVQLHEKDTAVSTVVMPIPSVTPVTVSDTKTFESLSRAFKIDYPADFSISESSEGGFYNELNLYSVQISPSDNYQKGTDFSQSFITISVSPTTAQCYSSNGQDQDMAAIKMINGLSFRYNPSQPIDDASMGGQRGSTSLFSSIVGKECYRLEQTASYRDLRGFSDGPYPPHYDEAKVRADFDNILSTFRFN